MNKIMQNLRNFARLLTDENAQSQGLQAIDSQKPERLAVILATHPQVLNKKALLTEALDYDAPGAVFLLNRTGLDEATQEEGADHYLAERLNSPGAAALLADGLKGQKREQVIDRIAAGFGQKNWLSYLFEMDGGIDGYLKSPGTHAEDGYRNGPFHILAAIVRLRGLDGLGEFKSLQKDNPVFTRVTSLTSREALITPLYCDMYHKVSEGVDETVSNPLKALVDPVSEAATLSKKRESLDDKVLNRANDQLLDLVILGRTMKAFKQAP